MQKISPPKIEPYHTVEVLKNTPVVQTFLGWDRTKKVHCFSTVTSATVGINSQNHLILVLTLLSYWFQITEPEPKAHLK